MLLRFTDKCFAWIEANFTKQDSIHKNNSRMRFIKEQMDFKEILLIVIISLIILMVISL